MKNTAFKDIRKSLKLTQSQFAEELGTHQQIIAMIENNKRDVPKSIRAKLYEVYNICYDEVVLGKKPSLSSNKELMSLFSNLSELEAIYEKNIKTQNKEYVIGKVIASFKQVNHTL